ncbi:MAG TPA: GNAT family N-acetyltransferase [Terracidiphilus sp.]|jgi:ribosomal protein S18 acetylase RimI-like enzyme|nr:GNAT family N-acetyltransferase [Terracidiphilus sp.]
MFSTRKATQTDAALIAAHRHAMFAEMRKYEAAALDRMRVNFVPWVDRMIAAGKYVGWIVEEDGKPAASAGFFELEWPPHPLDAAGEHRGYLLNFWVEPAYRGRGLARDLVREALAESRRRGIRVTSLHASDAGRHVYEPMGFTNTNELYFVDQRD